jgi:membrane associated rhomboid family serine protease
MRTPAVRRGTDPSWMRPITDRLSPVIKLLVIVDALLFAFYVVVKQAQPFFQLHLALNPNFLLGNELWQPATSLFVHVDLVSFLFNMLGLWFVGATIERQMGTRRFLLLFFGTGVVSNVATIILSVYMPGSQLMYAGCSNGVLALFVAFGTAFDRTPSRILGGLVLEARWLALILVGFTFLADASRGAWPALAGDVVTVTMAYLLSGGRGEFVGRLLGGMRSKRVRRRYQVLEGGKGRRPEDLN